MSCKDCIHKEICENFKNNICKDCNNRHNEFVMNGENDCCDNFKDKALIVELPCRVGDDLYLIADRIDGKSHIRRIMLTHNNMGNVLSRLYRDIYRTKDAAENVMKERENNDRC